MRIELDDIEYVKLSRRTTVYNGTRFGRLGYELRTCDRDGSLRRATIPFSQYYPVDRAIITGVLLSHELGMEMDNAD